MRSLFIQSVLYRHPSQCVVTADATAESLSSGTLDLAFTKSYAAALLVGSQLTSRITLRGADINLTDSTGNSVYEFSVNGTGSVDASRGGDAGLGAFDSELVPASIGDKLLGRLRDMKAANNLPSQQATNEVVALVRVFGTTLGDEDVTSSELSFPITYCEGCLVRYALTAINPQTGKCVNNGATDLPIAGCKDGPRRSNRLSRVRLDEHLVREHAGELKLTANGLDDKCGVFRLERATHDRFSHSAS